MKNKAKQVTGFCSLLINVLPFLVYPLLITQQNDQFINFLPFAIYYAFRRSALILFRDWEHDYPALGKIGLLCGLAGSTLGLFGAFSPIFWDLSGIGVGLASVLFPTAVNQNKRVIKLQHSSTSKSSPRGMLIQLIVILLILAITAVLHLAILNFSLLLLANASALYCYQYRQHPITLPAHLHWANYLLGTILFLAMFSMRIGRSIGVGQSVTLGIVMLAIFLILMAILLVTNWQRHASSPTYHRKALFFGVCGQYWSMYSTIFIGVTYGITLYYWVIAAYLIAIILSHYLPS